MTDAVETQEPKQTQTPEPIEMSALLPFVELTQSSGALSLADAFVVHGAIQFLNSEDSDEKVKEEFLAQIPESQKKSSPTEIASNVIVSSIIRGQAKGAFSLADAAKLAKLLRLV